MTNIKWNSIEAILKVANAEGRAILLEYEVYQILQAAGLDTPVCVLLNSADDPTSVLDQFKTDRLVVKVASTQFLHKTDMGGIQFIQRSADELRQAQTKILAAVEKAGASPQDVKLQISEFVAYPAEFGRDTLLSFRNDPAFGPIVNFGVGGIDTEFFGQNLKPGRSLALRSAKELTADKAAHMIQQTVLYPKLSGTARGQKKPWLEIGKVSQAICALAEIAEYFSPLNPATPFTIEEFEVNPMAVTPDGRLVALDGLAKFSAQKFTPTPKPLTKIQQLLRPYSALVIGASGKEMNPGRIILQNLLKGGGVHKNKIYLLHPKEKEIDGCPCFVGVKDLPEPVDMAVVTVPASVGTVNLIEELIVSDKVASITLITSGFDETDAGKGLGERLAEIIRRGHDLPGSGTVVNGPNCLGIISQPGNYNTFFLPDYKLPPATGLACNMAAVSQSGAYLVAQTSNIGHFISPRYAISYGNQIDLTVTDYMEYLLEDDLVDVVVLYMEGLKPFDGRRFLEVARRLIDEKGKSVIAFKTGRTALGAQAAASHTASIAGDYEVVRQLFAEAGVYLATDLLEFEDMTKTFSLLAHKQISGRKVGIITNAGFEATVSSDTIGELELAHFSDRTYDAIQHALPAKIIDFRNPIDTSPIADTSAFLTTVESMVADPQVNCVVVSAVPVTPALNTIEAGALHHEDISRPDSFPKQLIRIFHATSKPMTVAIDSGAIYYPAVKMLELAGIPVFHRIDRAMRALTAFVTYRKPMAR